MRRRRDEVAALIEICASMSLRDDISPFQASVLSSPTMTSTDQFIIHRHCTEREPDPPRAFDIEDETRDP